MKVAVLIAQGFEPIEAITSIDVLRRGEINVLVVSTEDSLNVVGDVKIEIKCDSFLQDIEDEIFDSIIIPGGFEGAERLKSNEKVVSFIQKHHQQSKLICSICDSTGTVLGEGCNIIKNVQCCGYPFSDGKIEASGGIKKDDVICYDSQNNILSSRGPATSTLFAFSILKLLIGEEKSQPVYYGLALNLLSDKV